MSDKGENIKISLCPIYHERQKRQFCAKHAINNLLQLPSQSSKLEHDSDFFDPIQQTILCKGKLYQHSAMHQVTVKECNLLADVFTTKECNILSGSGDGDDATIPTTNTNDINHDTDKDKNSNHDLDHMNDLSSTTLNLWNRWTSYHRTIWTGNYSFDVLEAALLKRNVSLKFHKASDPIEEDMSSNGRCNAIITIGFIINSPGSYLSPGRHWYAITRLRRVEHISEAGSLVCGEFMCMDAKTGEPMDYHYDEWYVINSSMGNVLRLNDSLCLLEYLKVVEDKGCTILRATMEHLCVLLDGDLSSKSSHDNDVDL